jgi:hypothetical protein
LVPGQAGNLTISHACVIAPYPRFNTLMNRPMRSFDGR